MGPFLFIYSTTKFRIEKKRDLLFYLLLYFIFLLLLINVRETYVYFNLMNEFYLVEIYEVYFKQQKNHKNLTMFFF